MSFYFHKVLQTFIYTIFWFQRVLRFAIEDTWIFRLLHDVAFSRQWEKRYLIFWHFDFMSSLSDEFTHK